MTEPQPGILFDVDGTLVDTNYFHAIAWWRALRDVGHEDVEMADCHRHIGMGADMLTQDLIGSVSEQAAELHSKYYESFWDEVHAFTGAAELLREVRDRGCDVVLASSSDAKEFDMLVAAIGADDGVITSSTNAGDVEKSKPAPDIFEVALQKANLSTSHAMVVGDSVWDVKAAIEAGLPCVGVLSGGFSAAELIDAGAVATYENVQDLLDNLDDSPLGRLWNAE